MPAIHETVGQFFEIWGGISGAQSTLLIMLDEGHLRRSLSLPLLGRVLALQPARRLGLENKGEIAIGKDADIVLIDWNTSTTLNVDDLLYTHKQSPYIGRTFACAVCTAVGSKYMAKEGLSANPAGQFIAAGSYGKNGTRGTEEYHDRV